MIRKPDRGAGTLLVIIVALLIFPGGAVMQASGQSSTQPLDPDFYFVQITDTHWGDADHLDRTAAAVAAINALPMDIACVVHTGDISMNRITDPNLMGRGIGIMEALTVPVLFVAGNHDILRSDRASTSERFIDYFGPLISETEFHGVVFITLYTGPLDEGKADPAFDPLQKLASALGRADRKPVILFHHTPSIDDFYRNRFHDGWKTAVRERWKTLINAHNVKAVITGHFHRDEFHWLGNVPVYTSSSIAGYWGRQATFRIFRYVHGRLEYSTQYLDD